MVGASVGAAVGTEVGAKVGAKVGDAVGAAVGDLVGAAEVGASDGGQSQLTRVAIPKPGSVLAGRQIPGGLNSPSYALRPSCSRVTKSSTQVPSQLSRQTYAPKEVPLQVYLRKKDSIAASTHHAPFWSMRVPDPSQLSTIKRSEASQGGSVGEAVGELVGVSVGEAVGVAVVGAGLRQGPGTHWY